MDFSRKTVVITGAAKGIGASTACQFARLNAQVALLDIDVETGKNLEAHLHKNAKFFHCDVSKEASIQKTFEDIIEWQGSIDILVNNAGIQGKYLKVHETSLEEWQRIMNINLTSQFLCAKYALQNMLKKNKGVIVNVTSVQAFMSQNRVAAYTTSKSAILGLTRSIAVDYAPHIRCVGVAPGSVDTPMFRSSINESANPEAVWKECEDMHLLKKVAKPEEIASLITFLSSEGASNMTGQTIRVDGGLGVTILGSKQD